MRGKRSKQYRKLMQQYGLSFGFREPYQVLVDADIIKDADRFKMDLVGGLERTLHGKVKPMITQCSIRHLYASASEPAKLFERRRCDHRPEEYPQPLTPVECLSSVVDPKGSKTNKHRYVVASQELDVRKAMREVMGYINRSVMIMEPMAGATVQNRERGEREKFRVGIKNGRAIGSHGMKRKREGKDEDSQPALQGGEVETGEGAAKRRKVRGKGPKGPNPLAVKKPKKRVNEDGISASSGAQSRDKSGKAAEDSGVDGVEEFKVRRKRRRKHKSGVGEWDIVVTGREHAGSPED